MDIMKKLYDHLCKITDNSFVQQFMDFEIHGFLSCPNWSDIVILLALMLRYLVIWLAVGQGQEGIDRYLFWNKQLSILFGYHLTPLEIRAVENRWLVYKYSDANRNRHFYFVERDFQTYVRVFARLVRKYYWKSNDEVILLADRFWPDWLALRDNNPDFFLRTIDKMFLELVATKLPKEEQTPPKTDEEEETSSTVEETSSTAEETSSTVEKASGVAQERSSTVDEGAVRGESVVSERNDERNGLWFRIKNLIFRIKTSFLRKDSPSDTGVDSIEDSVKDKECDSLAAVGKEDRTGALANDNVDGVSVGEDVIGEPEFKSSESNKRFIWIRTFRDRLRRRFGGGKDVGGRKD